VTVDLSYREEGSGPPLLILHGLFGSGSNWGRIARELATDHRVLVADLRNHGRSPHAPGMSYAELAADVAALLDRLGTGPVTVVGHSMGGKTAMRLALEHPERVARLVVVDIAPRAYRGNQDGVLAALQALDLDGTTRRAEVDARLAAHLPDPSLRAFLLTNLELHEGAFRWRVNLPALVAGIDDIEAFPTDGLGSYAGPTLFLAGRESDYLQPDDPARIRTLFPHAELAWIDGAGHWVHAAQPDAFLAALRGFLAAAATG